jgi:predicted RNase H-like nuclease
LHRAYSDLPPAAYLGTICVDEGPTNCAIVNGDIAVDIDARRMSKVAVIDSDGTLVRASGALRSNNDICEFAALNSGEDAIVAIDASLIVKNADKQRPVERQLMQISGPYDAGPYPANLSNVAFQPTDRIQQLVRHLEGLGFTHQPKFVSRNPSVSCRALIDDWNVYEKLML